MPGEDIPISFGILKASFNLAYVTAVGLSGLSEEDDFDVFRKNQNANYEY